jgi:adenylate cyclase
MALAYAAGELGIEPGDIEWKSGTGLMLPMEGEKPIIIPADEAGWVLIPYGAAWSTNEYHFFLDKIALARDDPQAFEALLSSELPGALVLAADTTTAANDFGITPFESVYPRSGIHTALLSGILDEFFYSEASFAQRVLIIFLILCIGFILGLCQKDSLYHGGFVILLIVLGFVTFSLWNWANISPWFAFPSALVFFSWLSGFIYRLFCSYREQLLYKSALGRYFPRALAERIASEGKIELVPEYKELTILFADIAGFTKWSSDKDPPVVHGFLTDYLENMAGILFEHGGTVDKFMGDGLLAFFGDPLKQDDHAQRCLRAAIAMQKRVAELREKWGGKIGIDLKIRIGVNSGRVIVGNLGTKTRIEYTVIGASVNLAQRMEGSAPVGGILIAGPTWDLTKDSDFDFSEKREVKVKGYDEPIAAFELLF